MKKISNRELKSNQRIIELAQEFKKLGDYPNCNSLNGKFLGNKRQAFKHYTNGTKKNSSVWYPSDIEVAKSHGLPDDWMLIVDFELKSNQNIILLAQEFKKLGTYPHKYSLNGKFLSNKRQAFKHYTNGTKTKNGSTWYPSDIEVAKSHGLPDDWMLTTKSLDPAICEKESNQRIIELAQEFKKLGTYPNGNNTNGIFLNGKRQAFKHYTNGTKTKTTKSIWYPSDIEVAKSHGLPDDWMLTTKSLDPAICEKESNQRIIELAQEFKKLGRVYPSWSSPNGKFLSYKRQAFKHYTNGTKTKNTKNRWYPSDIQIAKDHGLPDDWMLTTDFEKESNQKTIELAQEFKKLGTYPDFNSLNTSFLNTRRQAFKHYTNGTKTKHKWYPSDIEVAKAHGLPDDWMLKQKLESSGERRTRFILEKFNIKPTPQYRHKLCVNKFCLPFDFYFNKYKLHYFVEYNGEQHYMPVYGKTQIAKEENFKKTQKNDLIKLNFCKKYNYPLLVIPYWIKDNFENLISEFLKTTHFDPTFAQPTISYISEIINQ